MRASRTNHDAPDMKLKPRLKHAVVSVVVFSFLWATISYADCGLRQCNNSDPQDCTAAALEYQKCVSDEAVKSHGSTTQGRGGGPAGSRDTMSHRRTDAPRCEWSPVEEVQPAAIQCGFHGRTPVATPKPGLFDCGVRYDSAKNECVPMCLFKRCMGP
jgi:hypothetical protein